MSNLLELTLFGSPQVRINGQPVTGFQSSKTQALLYYLAVSGRPHTRTTLTGLLWGDQPEAAARVSLNKCLSNLHDLLGDAVLIERQTVAFNRDHPYHVDTVKMTVAWLAARLGRYWGSHGAAISGSPSGRGCRTIAAGGWFGHHCR